MGEALLDFTDIEVALQAGAGHLTWVLTTYQTRTNYQHSLADPVRCCGFRRESRNQESRHAGGAGRARDEVRFPDRLTGTPIENSSIDLWAIMDQLAPAALGSLSEFRTQFGDPG